MNPLPNAVPNSATPLEPLPPEPAPLVIANEFTAVAVRKIGTRQGERLELRVAGSGRRVLLDAMQLEAVAHLDAAAFSRLIAHSLGSTPQSPEENSKI